jgi:hypothetical protein
MNERASYYSVLDALFDHILQISSNKIVGSLIQST